MKNLIIGGYVVLMLLLVVGAVKASTLIKMDDKDVNYRTISHQMSDNDVEVANKKHEYERPLRIIRDSVNVHYAETKETRIKTLTGWETKVDTLKQYVLVESCDCN